MAGGNPRPARACHLRLGLLSWISCRWFLQGDWASRYIVEALDPDTDHYHSRIADRSEIRHHWSCGGSFGRYSDSACHQPGTCDSLCECHHPGYLWGIEILPDRRSGHGSDHLCSLLSDDGPKSVFAIDFYSTVRCNELPGCFMVD